MCKPTLQVATIKAYYHVYVMQFNNGHAGGSTCGAARRTLWRFDFIWQSIPGLKISNPGITGSGCVLVYHHCKLSPFSGSSILDLHQRWACARYCWGVTDVTAWVSQMWRMSQRRCDDGRPEKIRGRVFTLLCSLAADSFRPIITHRIVTFTSCLHAVSKPGLGSRNTPSPRSNTPAFRKGSYNRQVLVTIYV